MSQPKPPRHSRRASTAIALILLMGIGACSSDESGGESAGASPEEALTNGLDFQGQATPSVGPLPEGSASGLTVTTLPGAQPMEVTPGTTVTFQIPWQGGEIGGVNIGFGGSKHFKIPVPNAVGQSSGVVSVNASLAANVCANLSDTCHQIKCYEQVSLPDGSTVSKASAQQIVLNCTGGKGCDGGDAGSCGGHTTCLQYCSCVYGNLSAFEACDEALLACGEGCYEQHKDDPGAEEQCHCDTCAKQMDQCMQKLGCPPLGPDCLPHFTGCGG